MAAPKADDNNRDKIVFSQFKPRWPLLGFAAFIQAFYKEIFYGFSWQPCILPIYLLTLLPRNKRLMCLFPAKTGVWSGLTFNRENTVSPNRIRRCLIFLKVTSLRGCFLGGMKILAPGRSQKSDHHPSATCFLNSVYMQRIILVPSTRKFLVLGFS